MYGLVDFGGGRVSPPAGFGTVFEAPAVVLLKRLAALSGRVHVQNGSALYVVGEIYNTQEVWPAPDDSGDDLAPLHELMASDHWLELLPRLDGSFLIVHWDAAARRLRLGPDRYGSRKCFYAFRNGRLAFSPRVHDFLALGFAPRLDRDFLVQFLALKWLLGDRTVLDGVFPVPYGTAVEATASGVTLRRFWAWQFDESREALEDPEATARGMGDLFVASVDRRTRDKDTVLCPLSGGLDSRAVLGALLECKRADDVVAATFGTPGSKDFEFARLVAREAGVRHRVIDLSRPADYGREFLRKAIDNNGLAEAIHAFPSEWEKLLDVSPHALLGFMGDCLSCQLLPKHPTAPRHPDEREALRAGVAMRRWVPYDIVGRLLGLDPACCEGMLLDAAVATNGRNPHRLNANYVKCWDFPNRQNKFTIEQTFILRERFNYLLPFLDHAYVDLAMGVPLRSRIGQAVYRRMLAGRFPRLFRLPASRLGGRPLIDRWLPRQWARLTRSARRLIENGTLGLIPAYRPVREERRLGRVLRLDDERLMRAEGPFRDLCIGKLRRLCERRLVDADAVWALWDEHQSGGASHHRVLAVLVSLEFIAEVYVDGAPPPAAE